MCVSIQHKKFVIDKIKANIIVLKCVPQHIKKVICKVIPEVVFHLFTLILVNLFKSV